MDLVPKDRLLSLDGKVALVTGGAMGIGYGITYRLAEAGARVMIAGRNEQELQKTVDELSQKGFTAASVKADVSQEADVQNMTKTTVEKFGSIDILVNNAGIFPFAPLSQLTSELFDQVIAVNLRGVFLCVKYISEQMIKQGKGGKIVNITSIDALHPSMAGLAHYDASKHGVWGFTKNVALELAKNNIWINAVAPGGIMTPGVAKMQSGDPNAQIDRNPEPPKMEIAMGRMGVPDDIGKTVLFLVSDMCSYMTGAQIVVDGGYLLK